MCGIAGYIDFTKSSSNEEMNDIASNMASAISHRGPDHQGVWVDAQRGVALSHRRLSIVDCSPLGQQPMHSNSQRYTMVYNGEIYNFKKLRQQLSAQGSIFKGNSDSEVLLAAFSQWGIEKTLDQINGMFAIALFDRDENVLYLLRDRIGQKPLYYAQFDQTILFGSELKALKKHPLFVADINRDALAEYSRFCYVPDPLSIYQKTYKLPPGHFIRIHLDESVLTDPICYWDHQAIIDSQENTFLGTFEEAEERLILYSILNLQNFY